MCFVFKIVVNKSRAEINFCGKLTLGAKVIECKDNSIGAGEGEGINNAGVYLTIRTSFIRSRPGNFFSIQAFPLK